MRLTSSHCLALSQKAESQTSNGKNWEPALFIPKNPFADNSLHQFPLDQESDKLLTSPVIPESGPKYKQCFQN